MSDLLRMTGMYSGIDTESVIQSLVSAKQTKVTQLKNDQKKLQWKQEAWQDLNSKIYNLFSKTLSDLRFSASYKKKTTTSADPTKVTVVASEAAVNGTQTIKINKLAKSGYLTGAQLKEHTPTKENETKKWTVTDKLSELDSSLVGKKISITVGTGDEAKTKEIEITGDMTINKFVAELKGAGVNASFDENNQRFFVSSTGTGSSKEFSFTDNDGVLASLGLDENATYANGSKAVRIKAQDAEIELNDAVFTSDTNTFNVNGLTLNVTGETSDEITIVTTTDYDGIYETIKDFFSEYNELINEMDKLYNADSARKYDMLTDEEKEAMSEEEVEQWEDKIKGALLRKDSQLSSVFNGMINTMMNGFLTTSDLSEEEKNAMTASEYAEWKKEHTKYLSDYGIGTLNYFEAKDNERHAYHINGDADDEETAEEEDKLKAAIAADPDGTAEFFANLCKALYTKLDEQMARTEYSSIYKVYNDKQMQTEYDDYTKRISEAEEKLNDYEDKWYKKFSAMETALAKLQSNSSAVTSMLGGN